MLLVKGYPIGMRSGRSRRAVRRKRQVHSKVRPLTVLVVVALALVLFLAKIPLFSETKKQYEIRKGGEIEKVAASPDAIGSESGEIRKTVLEKLAKDSEKDSSDVVSGNEFAKVGVLDYHPGGYHVIYPDGFEISYSPSRFEARSPAGGRVVVTISGGSFETETDLSGASSEQKPVIEAASRLIASSFRFLADSEYDSKSAVERFSN